MKATIEQLKDLLDERIVVLDGSYGVLIQKTVKGEEAYRGDRFADHPRDLAGDPDLLNLTQPDVVRDIHRSYLDAAPTSSRPTPSRRRRSGRPTTGSSRSPTR